MWSSLTRTCAYIICVWYVSHHDCTRVSKVNRRKLSTITDGRNLQQQVTRDVLVIRIQAANVETTRNEVELSNQVFGTSGDPLNMRSQYAACSYDQMRFNPSTRDARIRDGVYTVAIPNTIDDRVRDSIIRGAATEQVKVDFGVSSLTQLANHVMVCIPPGTTGGWIAYGYVGSFMTVYNDL